MTTLPEGWTEEEYADQNIPEDVHGQLSGHVVVPVHVVHDESERLSPEFCACNTWTVPQYGPTGVIPVQLLTRRYKRYKAKFVVNFPAAGILVVSTKMESLTQSPTNPQGFVLTAAAAGNSVLPEYDCMQPMWAVGSIAGITVAVFDESYGEVAV